MPISFIRSCYAISELPADGLPEIAFIGRSNVGKSSLINAISKKKGLAKVSSTPGKTQSLNYFRFDDDFYLVDMPGYGYARVAKTSREIWGKLFESYFLERKEMKSVGVLVDSRHPGLANDEVVIDWFIEQNTPFFIVLTKTDKINQSELAKHENYLRTRIGTTASIFRTSSEKGRGVKELGWHLKDIAKKKDSATSE